MRAGDRIAQLLLVGLLDAVVRCRGRRPRRHGRGGAVSARPAAARPRPMAAGRPRQPSLTVASEVTKSSSDRSGGHRGPGPTVRAAALITTDRGLLLVRQRQLRAHLLAAARRRRARFGRSITPRQRCAPRASRKEGCSSTSSQATAGPLIRSDLPTTWRAIPACVRDRPRRRSSTPRRKRAWVKRRDPGGALLRARRCLAPHAPGRPSRRSSTPRFDALPRQMDTATASSGSRPTQRKRAQSRRVCTHDNQCYVK